MMSVLRCSYYDITQDRKSAILLMSTMWENATQLHKDQEGPRRSSELQWSVVVVHAWHEKKEEQRRNPRFSAFVVMRIVVVGQTNEESILYDSKFLSVEYLILLVADRCTETIIDLHCSCNQDLFLPLRRSNSIYYKSF